MLLALEEAELSLARGDVPVGAVLVDAAGRVIGRGHNDMVYGGNAVGHAEINAITQACRNLDNYRLNATTLVVTLEPCLMCAGAVVHSRIAGVVYGAADPKAGAVVSRLDGFELPFLNHRPWHCGGILEAECGKLLRDFFAARRK